MVVDSEPYSWQRTRAYTEELLIDIEENCTDVCGKICKMTQTWKVPDLEILESIVEDENVSGCCSSEMRSEELKHKLSKSWSLISKRCPF